MRLSVLLCAAGLTAVSAFAPIGSQAGVSSSLLLGAANSNEVGASASFDPLNLANDEAATSSNGNGAMGVAAATAAAWVASADVASAAGPDWGIFEGRIGSMLHPITMGSMFLLSLSTGILGLQWRRQRTIGDDITALKKTLPDLGGAKSVSDAIAAAESAEETSVEAATISALKAALPVQKEIDALVSERKELSSKGLRDQHFSQGALLAFIGTAFAIEGPLNTYARAGKLFPGPHLYAGAGLVVLWALAYACVPAMQKGSDTARTVHIGANVAGMSLFAWQIVSGLPIMFKVIELTKFP